MPTCEALVKVARKAQNDGQRRKKSRPATAGRSNPSRQQAADAPPTQSSSKNHAKLPSTAQNRVVRSGLVLELLANQAKIGKAALIFVGDTHQSIYQWRNAVNAMERLQPMASRCLPLTVSFRFNNDIANDASIFLNHVKNDMVQLSGRGPSINNTQTCATIGRTNATIIDSAIPMACQGKRIHFSGTNARDNWSPYLPYDLQVTLDVHWMASGRRDLVKSLKIKGFVDFNQILAHARGDGRGLGADIELVKQLEIVAKYGSDLPGFIAAIERQACSPSEAESSFSTAHRAKGNEWRNVQMLDDFFKISSLKAQNLAELMQEISFQAEMNLIYVTMTRACENIEYSEDMKCWLNRQKGG